MKICILSMQRINNFGSLLQSYSIKKQIESLGHEVSFIDIKKNEDEAALIVGEGKLYIDEIEGEKKKFSKLSKIDRYAINRIKVKQRQKEQEKLFEAFRKNILEIKDSDNLKKYDVCVIGSDEVFNCCAKTPWGFTTQLFGNVEQADKVITYAASCGSTKYEDLSDTMIRKIKDALEQVNSISVRDENTMCFMKGLTDKEVHMNLDPVVIGDFTEEIKTLEKVELPSQYCIVYSYYNRIHRKEEIAAIMKFCKEKKLELVTIGAPQMWIKKHLVLNPFEVLVAFSRAEFVITDTFHGTIFSAKYAKRFATLTRQSNQNKLLDLVKRLEIKEHLINNMSELEKAYLVTNDIESIRKIEKEEREKTISYFKKNI